MGTTILGAIAGAGLAAAHWRWTKSKKKKPDWRGHLVMILLWASCFSVSFLKPIVAGVLEFVLGFVGSAIEIVAAIFGENISISSAWLAGGLVVALAIMVIWGLWDREMNKPEFIALALLPFAVAIATSEIAVKIHGVTNKIGTQTSTAVVKVIGS